MSSLLTVAVAASLTAAAAAVAAEQPPAPSEDPPVFAVGLEVVKITVTVFDDEDNPVTGLEREDFAIFEDDAPQRIALFAKSYEPGDDEALEVDLGLLMDTSESMIKVLEKTQIAATRFLEAIPRARDLLTIFFDHDIRVSRFDSEHQQGLIRRIHDAKGGGNTALYDAITVYLSRVYGAGGRQVMVLFSDGEDSISSITMGETLEMVRSSNVTIYPIAFAESRSRMRRHFKAAAFLRQLADITGGEMFFPHGTRQLSEIYGEILAQLESQYVIGFVSDRAAVNDDYRKLKVKLTRDDLDVRHRKGYYPALPEDGVASGS